jgi:cytochrome P450
MTCAPTPKELSFQPLANGNPQSYFDFSRDGLFPIALPVSKKTVFIARDAETVRLIMTDPRFSLARLDPEEDSVTGTGYQSPDGLLRLDVPRIRNIRRRITPLFSERGIAPWRAEVEKLPTFCWENYLMRASRTISINNTLNRSSFALSPCLRVSPWMKAVRYTIFPIGC